MTSLVAQLVDSLRKSPVAYTGRQLQIPWLQSNNTLRQIRAMGSVGTLFAIVNRTSTSVAKVNWKLYRVNNSGERVEVKRHLALDLWNNPNPFMTRTAFVETIMQHIDLVGESWWIIGSDPRAASLPLSIWPIRPDKMAPIPDAEKFISEYEYTGPNGEKVQLPLDQVIFIKMPNPEDPFRGMGPVQSLLNDIDATKYSAEWNRNFFLNGAEPGGIVEIDRHLSDPEFDEMNDRWNDSHRGVANAHRVAFLEHGARWVERKFTNRDMQFVELRTVSRDTIREAYGIPKFALGDIDDVNRATADASKAWFAEELTEPRLERIKGALNSSFLPRFGDPTLEFDYESPVPNDVESNDQSLVQRTNAAKTLIDAGFDAAEVLVVVDLPDMKYNKPVSPPSPGGGNINSGVEARVVRPKGLVGVQHSDEIEQLMETASATMQEHWEYHRDRLVAAWESITAMQRAAIMRQIEIAVEEEDVEALANIEVPTDEASELLIGSMMAIAVVGAEEIEAEARSQGILAKAVVPREAVLAPHARVVVELLAASLAAVVGREALRLWGQKPGETSIPTQIDEFLRAMSTRALIDQLGGALTAGQNRGRHSTMLAAPKGAWYASERNDPRACKPCKGIDGYKFPTLDDADAAYPNGGYVDCYGGYRCRGGVIPIWEED